MTEKMVEGCHHCGGKINSAIVANEALNTPGIDG